MQPENRSGLIHKIPPLAAALKMAGMDTRSPSYARAFRAYIRRGIPIALSLKAEDLL
jgi:hypothetical protein